MHSSPKEFAIRFNMQARFFLETAALVSSEVKQKENSNPDVYRSFETVIVGTNHAFAAELMLKAIISFHSGYYKKQHGLKDLVNNEKCIDLKNRLLAKFDSEKHISYDEKSFVSHLEMYLRNLNPENKHDKKEIDNINKIKQDYSFESFDYFLEMHSNHFTKMRYACENTPPPLDMNFTSFLTQNLRDELEKELLIYS